MTRKLVLILALLASGCTSPETDDASPGALPQAESEFLAELDEQAESEEQIELPEAVLAELKRIEDEQFRLGAEMSGIREDADDVRWVRARLANMVAVDQDCGP